MWDREAGEEYNTHCCNLYTAMFSICDSVCVCVVMEKCGTGEADVAKITEAIFCTFSGFNLPYMKQSPSGASVHIYCFVDGTKTRWNRAF